MRCDLYAITLSIITVVTTSPISDLIERTIVDENSILSIPSPASAHGESSTIAKIMEQSVECVLYKCGTKTDLC